MVAYAQKENPKSSFLQMKINLSRKCDKAHSGKSLKTVSGLHHFETEKKFKSLINESLNYLFIQPAKKCEKMFELFIYSSCEKM